MVAVEQPQLLSGDPRGGDFAVGVAEVQAVQQPGPGQVRVVVVAAAQDPANAVERVAGPAAVPEGLLLDPAADLVDRVEPEPDDVERVEHAYRVRQLGAQRRGVPAERIERGHAHPGTPAEVALAQPRREHDTAATRHDIQ